MVDVPFKHYCYSNKLISKIAVATIVIVRMTKMVSQEAPKKVVEVMSAPVDRIEKTIKALKNVKELPLF